MTTSNPGLFACKKISFVKPFKGGEGIKVLASKSHSVKGTTRGNGAALWIESATKTGFTVCVLEYGDGSNGTTEVNWIALQSAPVGSQLGTTSINSWTTGIQCKRIAFQKVRFFPILILFTTLFVTFITFSIANPLYFYYVISSHSFVSLIN